MFKSQKNVFWEALLITMLIFGLGIMAGVILENWRTGKVESTYQQSEIDLLDVKLLTEIYSIGNFNCDDAIQENIDFADRIFKEAKTMGRYEKASRLTKDIVFQHKKYDLLRTMLFLNSIKIKEKCNNNYYEIVYFYDYKDATIDTKAKQGAFSKVLTDLKEKRGNEILLIPIAGDNEIAAVDLILNENNITKEELPVILINREIKITELLTLKELSEYLE